MNEFVIDNSKNRKSKEKKFTAFCLYWLVRSLRITHNNVPQSPCIILNWHEELLPAAYIAAKSHSYYMLSVSRDGDSLAPFARKLGMRLLRGSTFHRAVSVLKNLIHTSKRERVFLAVDGSRGPRRTIKAGAILAAQKNQIPIYCCRLIYAHYLVHKSWDQHRVPLPFAKVHAHYSPAIFLPPTLTTEEGVAQVSAAMLALGQSIHDPECL